MTHLRFLITAIIILAWLQLATSPAIAQVSPYPSRLLLFKYHQSSLDLDFYPDQQTNLLDFVQYWTPVPASLVAASNQQLLNLAQSLTGISTQDQAVIDQMLVISRQRYQTLLTLSADQPETVFPLLFSPAQISQLPEVIHPYIETPYTAIGTLITYLADRLDHSSTISTTAFYQFFTDQQSYFAYSSPPPEITTGSTVNLQALQLADYLYINSTFNHQITVLDTPPPSDHFGEQRIAVILFNFANDTRQPFTASQINSVIFNDPQSSVDLLYRESSFQKTWLTGQTIPTMAGEGQNWYSLSDYTNDTC